MQILSTWMLLASAALGAVAAEDLKIDVTVPVECDRKTQSGDKVQMHYRGTLAADGKQFDASMSRPASAPRFPSCLNGCALGSTGSIPTTSYGLTDETVADQYSWQATTEERPSASSLDPAKSLRGSSSHNRAGSGCAQRRS